MNIVIYGIIGSAAILFFLIIILIILLLTKNKKENINTSNNDLRRCPTCGQILEPEWKRCPFCTDEIITFPNRKIKDSDNSNNQTKGFLISLDDNDKIYKIEKKIVYIGSGNYNDVKLKDNSVSPQHAKIWLNETNNKFYIEDLNSNLGTKVNNEYINSLELRDGDTIIIANNKFVFKTLQ